jgi:antitoxin (DNA-binding transcriptional repressor) of toxin-antitoxin stability system
MKQISSRELQLNLSKYLSELPIEITKYNVPIARMVPISNQDSLKDEYIKELENRIKKISNTTIPYSPKIIENNKKDLGIITNRDLILKEGKKWETTVTKEVHRCKWPLGCNNTQTELGKYWEWVDGELKDLPMRLCTKHQSESNKRKDNA